MRQEENAAGITYEETKVDQALEEITDKEKLTGKKKPSRHKKKQKGEKAAADEHKQSTMDSFGQTVTRHFEHFIRISFLFMGNLSSTASVRVLSFRIYPP